MAKTRKQVEQPLAVTPTIDPTIRQNYIEPGFTGVARPLSARETPLGQLGEALSSFAPRLGHTLTQLSLSENERAKSLGALEAQKAGAKTRMEVIESALKAKADAGEFPASRLPAAMLGAQTRLGALRAGAATGLLYARFNEVSRFENRTDPSQVVTEVYNELLKEVPDSLEAREAFDAEFSRIADAFRREAARGYEVAAQEVQNQTRATRLVDVLTAVTAADDSITKAGAIQTLGAFIEGTTGNGGYKTELKKHEVAQRVAQDSQAYIRDLISRDKVEDALELIDVLHDYDLTGSGGKLGKTGPAAEILVNLRNEALSRNRSDFRDREETERIEKSFGLSAVRKSVVELQGAPLTREQVQELTAKFRAENPDRPDALYYFEKGLEEEQQGDAASVADVVFNIKRKLEKFDTKGAQELLEFAQEQKLVNAKDAFAIEGEIRGTEEFQGIKNPADVARYQNYLYDGAVDRGGTRFPTFETAEQFIALTEDQKSAHKARVMGYYESQLNELILASGDKTKAAQSYAEISRKADEAARKYADKVTLEMAAENRTKEFRRLVEKRVSEMRAQTSVLKSAARSPDLPTILAELGKSAAQEQKEAASNINRAMAAAANRFRPEGAKPDQKAVKAYIELRFQMGFTPDEIKKGETTEGVQFSAREIDPRHIPVFESMAQLEAEYNNGEPAPGGLFRDIKSRVSGGSRLTDAQFYQAQRLILEHKAERVSALEETLRTASK